MCSNLGKMAIVGILQVFYQLPLERMLTEQLDIGVISSGSAQQGRSKSTVIVVLHNI